MLNWQNGCEVRPAEMYIRGIARWYPVRKLRERVQHCGVPPRRPGHPCGVGQHSPVVALLRPPLEVHRADAHLVPAGVYDLDRQGVDRDQVVRPDPETRPTIK